MDLIEIVGDRYDNAMIKRMRNGNNSDQDIIDMYHNGKAFDEARKLEEEIKAKEIEYLNSREYKLDKVENIIIKGINIAPNINKVLGDDFDEYVIEVNGILKRYGYVPTNWSEHERVRNGNIEFVREHYKTIKRILN